MSINTAHVNNGVLIHAGEFILIFSDNVTMEFSGHETALLKGTKSGRIYLTTHRIIFNNKSSSDELQSFSMPFISMNDVDIEQPVFGANYIKGKVYAQPNGNWTGEARFKILFKAGGAIEFGQAMLKAASMAMRNATNREPPPYTPPTGDWYQAPPPAYTPNPQGYYGWVPPQSQNFPSGPPPNGVFMTDNPPPYPGIIPAMPGNNYPGNSMPGNNMPGNYMPGNNMPGNNYMPGNTMPGYSNGPQYNQGYPNPMGYGQPAGGYNNQYTGQSGYLNQNQGAMGFQAPGSNSKENEAAQSAYYDPNHPQTAYIPPPAYYEPPPSYNSLNKKEQ